MEKRYWQGSDSCTLRAWGLKKQGKTFRNKDLVRLEVVTRRFRRGSCNGYSKRFYLFVYDDKEGMTRCLGNDYETEIEAITEAAQLFKLEKY